MTKVPEMAQNKSLQTLSDRIRDLSIKMAAGFFGAALAMIMIGMSLPFMVLFIGGFAGWAIAEVLFIPPIVVCVRKMGFSDIWVEKTKKAVSYSGVAFSASAYFGVTFLK